MKNNELKQQIVKHLQDQGEPVDNNAVDFAIRYLTADAETQKKIDEILNS